MANIKNYAALAAIALLALILFLLGLRLLTAPRIMLIAHPMFIYQGISFLFLAVFLAWFREWLSQKILWMCAKAHRLASALIMAAVVGSEGLMHTLNIPHLEGWWIPLMSGGAAAAISAWLSKWRKYDPKNS